MKRLSATEQQVLREVRRIAPGDGAARLLARLVEKGLAPEALFAAAKLCCVLDEPREDKGELAA